MQLCGISLFVSNFKKASILKEYKELSDVSFGDSERPLGIRFRTRRAPRRRITIRYYRREYR